MIDVGAIYQYRPPAEPESLAVPEAHVLTAIAVLDSLPREWDDCWAQPVIEDGHYTGIGFVFVKDGRYCAICVDDPHQFYRDSDPSLSVELDMVRFSLGLPRRRPTGPRI